jgi:hypothetical protein
VRALQSAIGKCVRLGYKPWKRLPGVLRKRNVLRSSSMAYPPSIAEIPATTLRSLRTPPEAPPLSRTASARRCGGPSTRHQSMVSPYGFAVGSPVARHYAMFPRSVCSTLRSSFRLLSCARARQSFQLNHQRAKVTPGSRPRPAATNASVGFRKSGRGRVGGSGGILTVQPANRGRARR